MVDGKKEDDFDYVIALQFSPDSHHLVYLAAQKDNWFLVRDGKHPTDWVADFFGVTFSPDSNRMAFAASLPNKRQALILDNVKCEEFNMVSSPIFSSDGKKVAYVAKSGREWFTVTDGKRGPSFDRLGPPVFDAEGRETITVATKDKKEFVLWGDQNGEKFDEIATGDGLVEPLNRSPISSTVAYRARVGGTRSKGEYEFKGAEWYIVVGNRKTGPFDQVWAPQFSPDGKKVAFGARKGADLWWKVVDSP